MFCLSVSLISYKYPWAREWQVPDDWIDWGLFVWKGHWQIQVRKVGLGPASIDLFAWKPGMWDFPTVTETKSIKSIVLVVSRCGWSPFIAGIPTGGWNLFFSKTTCTCYIKFARFWAHTSGHLVHMMPDPEIGKQKPPAVFSLAETTPYIVLCLHYHFSSYPLAMFMANVHLI